MKLTHSFLTVLAAALAVSGPAFAARKTSSTRSSVSVAITSPSGGATVHGTVPVYVSASSGAGIKTVTLYVNGSFWDRSATAPFTTAFSSASLIPGKYTLTVVAVDGGGNQSTSAPVSVNVTAPTATDDVTPPSGTKILSPVDWQLVKGVVPVTIATQDNVGIAYVALYIDSNPPINLSPSSLQYNWDTSRLVAGTYHHIQVIAYDKAFNHETSPFITVQIGG